jgi:transcriptional regulator GlxA family with amidase domain
VTVAAIQQLGNAFAELDRRLRRAATSVGWAEEKRQAAVWDILWTLASTTKDSALVETGFSHPVVARAVEIIERRLNSPIIVEDLAHELEVSFSYLSRLFGIHLNETVVGYIRRRRSERAAHLLLSSTMPIKSIAVSVGVSDLQQFNRLIHHFYHCSPRELRSLGGEDSGQFEQDIRR